MSASRITTLSAVLVLALGCASDTLTATAPLPRDYSTGSAATLAGGTAADDVWLSTDGASGQPAFLHFDGEAWTSVPLADFKAALKNDYPDCATGTAGRNAIYCALGGKVFELTSTGAFTEVSAGVPVPVSPAAMLHAFNRTGSPVYLATQEGGNHETQALHRREGNAWVALPEPPGPVGAIVPLAGAGVWISGSYRQLGANTSSDPYFATLEGAAWKVTRFPAAEQTNHAVGHDLFVSPTDIWRVVKFGGILASGGGSYGPVPSTLAHFDGTAWTNAEVAVPERFVSSGVAWAGFGLARRDDGQLALMSSNGEELVATEWDGTTVGDSVTFGHFTTPDIGPQAGITYLGRLGDGTLVLLNPNGRDVLLGELP